MIDWRRCPVFLLLLFTTAASSSADEAFEFTMDDSYSVTVFIAGSDIGNQVATLLKEKATPAGSQRRLLLQSLDDATIVEVLAWPTTEAASAYRASYIPAVQAYWQRVFKLSSKNVKPGKVAAIYRDSAVQWSEFLLRDAELMSSLRPIVLGMAQGMTAGGPATLESTQVLVSANSLSLGLLGIWSDRDGFHVFEAEKTFGDNPYWSDFADNAHWMTQVIDITYAK